jgi:hypothetical protein
MNQTTSKVRVMATSQHTYKPNLFQAELRQNIVREYNSTAIGNNMQSAFAPRESYNLPETRYDKERVCWVDIPNGWTVEKAQQHLDNIYASGAEPCIYQVLSFDPILTDNDYAWMEKLSAEERLAFIENKKNSQQILNQDTGEIVTRDDKTLYRKLFYTDRKRDDVDLTRTRMVSAVDKKTEDTPAEKTKEQPAFTF